MRHVLSWLACAGSFSLGGQALANCAQGVCAINTDWEAQGVPMDSGTRVDLRFEYVDQDQPRSGSGSVAVGDIDRHHSEVRTINRNWIATLDHSFDARWGVALTLPYASRSHHHIHHHHGAQINEYWDYSAAGDVRFIARRQFDQGAEAAFRWGITAGLKLPTGKRDIRNDDGDEAERTLQSGTGTTDGVLGAYYHLTLVSMEVFSQVQVQRPFAERAGFAPGVRSTLDVGGRLGLSERIGLLAQINVVLRERDRGDDAEPEDSGGIAVYFSPGLSATLTRSVRIYGFVQLPLYRYVNGVQLTEDWSASIGLSIRF